MPKLADLPSNAELQTKAPQLANSLLIDNILKQTQQCPVGSAVASIDMDGKVQCRCIGGTDAQIGTDSAGMPICKSKTCPNNESFLGLDGQGNPICADRDEEYSCFRKPFNGNLTADCGYDTYGQPIRMRGLYNNRANCRVLGGGNIECDPMEALCCIRRIK